MNKKTTVITLFFLAFISCQSVEKTEKKAEEKQDYLRWVGDIEQDTLIDNPDFKVCHGDDKIFQYFNLSEGPVYSGEKTAILNRFKSEYKPLSDNNQEGFIRIRFVVNCEGKAGRFRVLQSDYNYQEIAFDKEIVEQLLSITKGIEKWKVQYKNEIAIDYYMYLIFKITDGQLIEILP